MGVTADLPGVDRSGDEVHYMCYLGLERQPLHLHGYSSHLQKRNGASLAQTGSPKIKQELAGSNRKAIVEDRCGSCTTPVKQIRFMHGGVGEAGQVWWRRESVS